MNRDEFEKMMENMNETLAEKFGGKVQVMGEYVGSAASNLSEHYGEKGDYLVDRTKEMLIELIKTGGSRDLVDKYFSKLDGAGRLDVLAFVKASQQFARMTDDD